MEVSFEAKRIYHRIRNTMLKHDPMFLAFHNVKFEAPIAADPANKIQGGYSACMRLEWIVGFVRFLLMDNGTYTLQFGTYPKNAQGVNEWKETMVVENVTEDTLVSQLLKYDDIHTPVHIPGAVNSKDVKKRKKPKK